MIINFIGRSQNSLYFRRRREISHLSLAKPKITRILHTPHKLYNQGQGVVKIISISIINH